MNPGYEHGMLCPLVFMKVGINMAKLRVGIVFGGKSAEHEVSLQSAKNILDALDRERFEPVLVGIDKQGQWHLSQPETFLINADDPARIALHPSCTALAVRPGAGQAQLKSTINQDNMS